MYLSINQHDQFRTLLMGFEIPYRKYIADMLISKYKTEKQFENIITAKGKLLSSSDPYFLKNILPNLCSSSKKITDLYSKFCSAVAQQKIVPIEQNMPTVGALNIVTFSLKEDFQDLYILFSDYQTFCGLAEQYRYARNKLDHPGCCTLEDSHLIPVLSFVRDITNFLADEYFIEKSKEAILQEITILQSKKMVIPISKQNLKETPYLDSHIVCRDVEIAEVKAFIYGEPGSLRKQHSQCIYGYGGIGKTALVIEVLKRIVQDILDRRVENDYSPEYMFFYTAKKRQLHIADETGRVIQKQTPCHFQTADELIALIYESLGITSFKSFHDEGLIVVDNLEALSLEERKKVKHFIDTQTPTEMQFLITSRNSESYDSNKKLSGFNEVTGIDFVGDYIKENSLDLNLSDDEIKELLDISKGNTLVLVLGLRRLSQRLVDMSGLKSDFSCANAWRSMKQNIAQLPPNAYETISDFMFRDTFEQIEEIFPDRELFNSILKIFAINPNTGMDLPTVCILTEFSYPSVEGAVDALCNYLIIERNETTYSLNQFAEAYIIQKFIPDAETFESLSKEISRRNQKIQNDLEQLKSDMDDRPSLQKIMKDWQIVTVSDQITAAKMYNLYGKVNHECRRGGPFKVQAVLEDFIIESKECERITIHPYIKYQGARILQLIDNSNILKNKHAKEIRENYSTSIYIIKTVEQYNSIQHTKSYAVLLWLYGQFLSDQDSLSESIRFLEESQTAFKMQENFDQQYYQCITLLGWKYLDRYRKDREGNISYLRRARSISRELQEARRQTDLGRASKYAKKLYDELLQYGTF